MKKKLNIAIFTDQYFPQISGVVTSTLTLKENLESLGHQVTIVTVQHPDILEPEEGIIRLPSMTFRPLPSQRVGTVHSTKALRQLAALNLDIIHTQTEFSIHIFAQTVARRFNIPIIHTYHTMYLDYLHYISPDRMIPFTSKVVTRLIKSINEKAELVLTPTEKSKSHLLECDVDTPIQVVPTGIELKRFQPSFQNRRELEQLSREYGIQKQDKVLLYIGRVAREKSIHLLIRSLPAILKKDPDVKLLIVGDGPELTNLELLAEELSLKESVIFAGEQPWTKIGLFYNLGHLFLSGSTSETQGLTFLEAMAAELPVIAKRDKSLELIINKGETGFFFETEEDLTKIVLEVFSNPELLKNMKEKAAEMAENYSCLNFARTVEGLYRKVIAGYEPSRQRARFPRRQRSTVSKAS